MKRASKQLEGTNNRSWFGNLPANWTTTRVGQVFRQRNERVSDKDFPPLSVTKKGILPQLGHVAKTDDNENRKLVKKGDFVINSRSDRKGSAGVADSDGSVSLINTVLKIGAGLDLIFCHHLLRSYAFQEEFYRMGSGLVADLWSTNFNAMKGISLPLPPMDEQRAIADYLDRETARIDGLIEKKARFIALLKEKRVAVIAHAVTKGLNRNAPMKDSGQAWLGEVPAHWEVVPSIWLFTESKERAHEDDEQLSATQKYGVIPLSEFERLEQRQVTKAFLNLEQRKHVEVGDFVISMRSMDGGLERAKARGCVRSSYVVLKSSSEVDVDFFTYLFKSISYIQALRATSSFIRDGQDLNFWNFRAVKLPRLPLDEQAEIARFLSNETARIDTLITKTEQSIALLKEKRAALITAAITGKIDVRSAA